MYHALWDRFIVYYGLAESLIAELCQLARVWKLHTSPYHPQTNRQCECFNHILINMLGTLPSKKKSSWKDMVPMLVHVCNCTRSIALGFSPYYLMYGWKPLLSVDLYFGIWGADMNTTTSTKFVQQWCEGIRCAHKICPTSYRKREQKALAKLQS